MSTRNSWKSATRSLPDQLDLQMLCDAQACLRCLHSHQTPSAGQIQAFNTLHVTYDPVIRSFVMACGVPASDADDCCQEVWQDLYMKLTAFQSDGTQARFCSWLNSIAHSKATNFLRYRARHATEHLRSEEEAVLPSRDAGPVANLEQQFRNALVQRALAVLRQQVSPLSYGVFEKRLIEGLRVADIATEMDLSPAQVRSRLYHTKQSFRHVWQQVVGKRSPT